MGYKEGNHCAILDDSWTVNLRSTREESENIMMASFLAGIGGCDEKIKNQLQGNKMISVDVSQELKDLMEVYMEAETHLKGKEANALITMTHYMKNYLKVQEERIKISNKIFTLNTKMENLPCDDFACDENEEGDDE